MHDNDKNVFKGLYKHATVQLKFNIHFVLFCGRLAYLLGIYNAVHEHSLDQATIYVVISLELRICVCQTSLHDILKDLYFFRFCKLF